MAKILDKKLYLLERERPEWWMPEECVQIIFNKEDKLFIWHRQEFKEGYLKIDETYSIELNMVVKDWHVQEHTAESICLLNNIAKLSYDKFSKSKENIEDNKHIFSCLSKNIDDMRKKDYTKLAQEAVFRFLEGKISVAMFRELTKSLHVIIENSDIYEIDEEEKEIISIEELKATLLKKATAKDVNIIDIVRTINSINADGGEVKERQLDDIIIETETKEENLEDFEIEI